VNKKIIHQHYQKIVFKVKTKCIVQTLCNNNNNIYNNKNKVKIFQVSLIIFNNLNKKVLNKWIKTTINQKIKIKIKIIVAFQV